MNTSLLKKILMAALFAGTLFTSHAALKVGDPLPDLAGFALEGKLPESLAGKVVILDFWASWCGPCKDSFPAMNDLQKKYGDRGLVIIAVNVDEAASDMRDFLKDNKAAFVVVRDVKQKLVAAAGVKVTGISLSPDDSILFYATPTALFQISATAAVGTAGTQIGPTVSGNTVFRGISLAPKTPG